MRRLPVVVISAVVLAMLFMVLCTFVQRPYEDVLLDRFGKVVQPVTLVGGWKLCLPTDSVVRFDRRLHLHQSILRQLNVGGESMSVQVYLAWKISDPQRFYNRLAGSDQAAQDYLTQKVQGTVASHLARMSVAELFNANPKRTVQIEGVEGEIMEKINAQLKGTETEQGSGMEVVQLGFSRMAFPPKVAESVYKRMVQERMTQASRLNDEGVKEAKRLQGEGKREKDNIDADARRQAGPLRGEADAKAVEILAAAMETSDAKDFYQFWKSMELFKNSLTKNTYLVLPANSPIIEYLLTPPVRGSTTRPAAK